MSVHLPLQTFDVAPPDRPRPGLYDESAGQADCGGVGAQRESARVVGQFEFEQIVNPTVRHDGQDRLTNSGAILFFYLESISKDKGGRIEPAGKYVGGANDRVEIHPITAVNDMSRPLARIECRH